MAKKILIIQTAYLGDILLSIPLIKNTKEKFPDSKIYLICRKGFSELFLKTQLVDYAYEVNKNDKASYAVNLQEVFKEEFDLLLCPHESIRSVLLSSKIRAKLKVGFKNWWNFLVFKKRVVRDMGLPDSLRQLSLLSPLSSDIELLVSKYRGQIKSQLASLKERVFIPDWASMNLTEQLQKIPLTFSPVIKSNTVFISPGSIWTTKRWTKEGFREVAISLVQAGYDVIFVGSGDEKALCKELQQNVKGSREFSGQTSVLELAQLFTKGKFLICNDSGAMHVASVVDLPTIAIFGPTVLELGYEPWQDHSLVVQKKLACRPCGKHGHQICPLGTHECMKAILPADVLRMGSSLEKITYE